ncbi:MAG: beta-galactosidase [Verrucomicrobiota bacterium]
MKAHALLGGLFTLALAMSANADVSAREPTNGYRVILWTADAAFKDPARIPLLMQRLRELGVNTGMVHHDAAQARNWTNHGFPYYVENIINRGLCLKWNSKVRDWDKFVTTWKVPRDEAGMIRDYCLDDPTWQQWACGEMQQVVRQHVQNQPVLYDIRDELSVTISANPFDYDFSPMALQRFREWLKTQYPDLGSLNREWDTQFSSWDAVKPFTTDQIKNRMASGMALPRGQPDWQAVQRLKFDVATAGREPMRWNLAPWCDFRTYMDISLARALDQIRGAAHSIDLRTPVGIEGTQMPSAFGGYDLWRLSQALDWVEPYDVGNAREIFASFLPGKPILTTVFENETKPARRRLWHLLLQGDTGCIVWWSEDCLAWNLPDLPLTPKARALAPVLKEMTSPLAALFRRAQREYDPIAIHYSQASIQVDWLLESTVDGSTWLRRFSSYEARHNRQARVRNAWLKLFQDLGFSPRFVSYAEVERGRLLADGYRAFIMPDSLALSDREAQAINAFSASQGESLDRFIFADGSPGAFDQHGKLRAQPALKLPALKMSNSDQGFFSSNSRTGEARHWDGDISGYALSRLSPTPDLVWPIALEELLAPLPREIRVPMESRTRIYRFRLGNARLVAFERNIDYHMSEDLKQTGGNEALEKPAEVAVRLAAPAHVYDLASRRYLGRTDHWTMTVDPWQPALYALLPEAVEPATIMEYLK